MRKDLITEIDRFKELMGLNLLTESIEYEDISSLSKLRNGMISNPKYFILHHTGGRTSGEGTVDVLNNRTIKGKKVILGVQWVIDREGKIFRTLPKGAKGKHIKDANMPGVPKDINNSTAEGVEIVGNNNSDILEIQCLSALKLVKGTGYSVGQIYGHGEVNSHKARNEGQFCKSFIKEHWGDNLDDLEKEILKRAPNPQKNNEKPKSNNTAKNDNSVKDDSFADEGGFNFGSDYDEGDTFNLEGSFTEKAKEKGSDALDWAKDTYDDLSGKYSDWKGNAKFAGLSGIQKTFADALKKLTNF